MRFGPHLFWLLDRTRLPLVDSISNVSLDVEPTTETFFRCQVGPIAIDLPESMRGNFDAQRDLSNDRVSLRFTDGIRTAHVNVTPMKDFVMFPMSGFPNKKNDTHSQLYRQIAAVKSSDFSFWMTTDELRWHKWLITNRRLLHEPESIENIDCTSMEGNLLRFPSTKGICYNFEWATTDGEWKGAVSFEDPADNPNWIKHAASTFDLNGDTSTFLTGDTSTIRNAPDMAIKALVTSLPEAENTK